MSGRDTFREPPRLGMLGIADNSGDWVGSDWMSAEETLANATVRIRITDGDGVGTGFHFLKPEIIVSNAHVVEHLITSGTPMSAVAEDGREWQLNVLGYSRPNEHDFAIMSASGASFDAREFLSPDTSPITRGRQILFAGYPHGLEPLLVYPSQVAAPLKGREFYFDGMIHGGNSGGPITDESGKQLLGIVTARRFLGDSEMKRVDTEMGALVGYLNGIKSKGTVVLMGVNFTEFASALSKIALLTNELIRKNSTTGIGVGIHTRELLQKAKDLKLL
jgi:S1-C subfamily serine protease